MKTLEVTVHVVHRPGLAGTRIDVDLRGAVRARAEVAALDPPRPAAEDLDEVVVVVAVRARQRVVEIGVADHDVVGRTAHDVGIAHVVEAHVVDREPAPLREDARQAVLAVRELGVGDRHVAIVGIELQRDAEILVERPGSARCGT